MSSCTPMWMWVYSRGLPFTYSSWWIQLSVDGATLVDAWPYFSGLKVGQIHLYSFSPFIINRCGSRNTIIPGPCSWLKLFSLAVFVFLSQGLLNSSRVLLQIRPVFVHNRIQKYLIDTLEASATCNNFSHQVLPPHRHFLVIIRIDST
jgi:hypothetical protein